MQQKGEGGGSQGSDYGGGTGTTGNGDAGGSVGGRDNDGGKMIVMSRKLKTHVHTKTYI